jgi:hypothetical protein
MTAPTFGLFSRRRAGERMPFQLTRRGVERPGPEDVRAWRAAFAEESCLRLPGFLEPAFLGRVQQRIAGAAWREFVQHKIDPPAIDLFLDEPVVGGLLAAVMQDPDLFDTVQSVTGCDPIGSFRGRVYRLDPRAGHEDSWHTDTKPGTEPNNRMIALSLNLSPAAFEGGVLELRHRGSDRLLHRAANTVPGDAVLFRIDRALEHRVTAIEGVSPRIAWAGWFQREPRVDLGRLVRSLSAW